jgi:hypothetical protein
MYIRSLVTLFQGWPARILGLFLLILCIWVSCVLLAILIDPYFPDDVSVSLVLKLGAVEPDASSTIANGGRPSVRRLHADRGDNPDPRHRAINVQQKDS